MKKLNIEEVIAKVDSLDLMNLMLPYNVAMKLHGVAVPYFCSVIKGDGKPTRYRICFFEGWQMMHTYVMMRVDPNFGVYSNIVELAGYQVLFNSGAPNQVVRTDAGYMPVAVTSAQADIIARLLWEVYGLLMRLETDPQMPMRYAEERSIFARVEEKKGVWVDTPMTIPEARHHVEKVTFNKDDLKKAKDLPIVPDMVYELDFGLDPIHAVKAEQVRSANGVVAGRPRTVYELRAADVATRQPVMNCTAILMADLGLAGLWESMPQQVLHEIIRIGKVPGGIRVGSARVFRLVRSLCSELPFKLSLHDSLSVLPPYGMNIARERETRK